jgi:hypothetical protein
MSRFSGLFSFCELGDVRDSGSLSEMNHLSSSL